MCKKSTPQKMKFRLVWQNNVGPTEFIEAANVKELVRILRDVYGFKKGLVDVYYEDEMIGSVETYFYCYWQWPAVAPKLPLAVFQFFDPCKHWAWLPESQLRQRSNPYLEVLYSQDIDNKEVKNGVNN